MSLLRSPSIRAHAVPLRAELARSPIRRAPAPMPPGFGKLASHMDIAWDLDGTLVGHPASPLLHRFIRATPRIRHVIVTFRSLRRCGDPWADLAAYHEAPGRDSFDSVVFIQDEDVEEFARSQSTGWLGRMVRPDAGPDCREWKGAVCHEHGLTALVDDMTKMVAPGCRRYGVELFHPKDFMQAS